jgi:hypothetical protein
MAARTEDHFMAAEYDGHVIATARYNADAAADGQGAWIVPGLPRRLFSRNQAMTAMVLAERLAAGLDPIKGVSLRWSPHGPLSRDAHVMNVARPGLSARVRRGAGCGRP